MNENVPRRVELNPVGGISRPRITRNRGNSHETCATGSKQIGNMLKRRGRLRHVLERMVEHDQVESLLIKFLEVLFRNTDAVLVNQRLCDKRVDALEVAKSQGGKAAQGISRPATDIQNTRLATKLQASQGVQPQLPFRPQSMQYAADDASSTHGISIAAIDPGVLKLLAPTGAGRAAKTRNIPPDKTVLSPPEHQPIGRTGRRHTQYTRKTRAVRTSSPWLGASDFRRSCRTLGKPFDF